MSIRDILILGNQRLWQPSLAVNDIYSGSTRETIRDLCDTLANFRLRHSFGRAVAAPQIGVQQRIIFTNVSGGFALINPEISTAGTEMFEVWDDCFSLPDLMVRVRRQHPPHVRHEVDLLRGLDVGVNRGDLPRRGILGNRRNRGNSRRGHGG